MFCFPGFPHTIPDPIPKLLFLTSGSSFLAQTMSIIAKVWIKNQIIDVYMSVV